MNVGVRTEIIDRLGLNVADVEFRKVKYLTPASNHAESKYTINAIPRNIYILV